MRIVTLFFLAAAISTHAATFTAVSNGNWVVPQTWSCRCVPSNGDHVIIPEGITVTITRPVAIWSAQITVSGELDLTNGMLQVGEGDRITVLPGGKIFANGLGGVIYSGITQHIIDRGKVIVGPATIGSSVFPIALMFFEVEHSTDHGSLNWASAGEIDVERYEVLASPDSVNFQSVGEVKGSNYSLRRRDYTFPIGNHGTKVEFYRLEAIQADSARVVLSTILAK